MYITVYLYPHESPIVAMWPHLPNPTGPWEWNHPLLSGDPPKLWSQHGYGHSLHKLGHNLSKT